MESTYWFRTSDMTWSNNTALARVGDAWRKNPPATIGMTNSVAAAAVRKRGIELSDEGLRGKTRGETTGGKNLRVGRVAVTPRRRDVVRTLAASLLRGGWRLGSMAGCVQHSTSLGARIVVLVEERVESVRAARCVQRRAGHRQNSGVP